MINANRKLKSLGSKGILLVTFSPHIWSSWGLSHLNCMWNLFKYFYNFNLTLTSNLTTEMGGSFLCFFFCWSNLCQILPWTIVSGPVRDETSAVKRKRHHMWKMARKHWRNSQNTGMSLQKYDVFSLLQGQKKADKRNQGTSFCFSCPRFHTLIKPHSTFSRLSALYRLCEWDEVTVFTFWSNSLWGPDAYWDTAAAFYSYLRGCSF